MSNSKLLNWKKHLRGALGGLKWGHSMICSRLCQSKTYCLGPDLDSATAANGQPIKAWGVKILTGLLFLAPTQTYRSTPHNNCCTHTHTDTHGSCWVCRAYRDTTTETVVSRLCGAFWEETAILSAESEDVESGRRQQRQRADRQVVDEGRRRRRLGYGSELHQQCHRRTAAMGRRPHRRGHRVSHQPLPRWPNLTSWRQLNQWMWHYCNPNPGKDFVLGLNHTLELSFINWISW